MAIMRDMVDKAEWERMDKGLPPEKKHRPKMDDPEQPTVKGQIKADRVPADDLEKISGQKRNVRDKDGVTFIGFDVSIQLKDKKPITGWITDGDLIRIRKAVMGRKDVEIQVAE